MEVIEDPADRLPAMVVGDWSEKKHRLLRHYVDISHGARRGWVDPAEAARRKLPGEPAGATYIELFAGPGRLFLKGSGNFVDGSPLVAHKEAAKTRTAFTAMHLGDERQDFCDALRTRLEARGAKPLLYPMTAIEAAARVVDVLNPYGLNFAFLDPFGFEEMPFSIIKTLGRFKRMDVLIYVSAMGLQKNLSTWMKSTKPCVLDDFAPGWRDVVSGRRGDDIVTRGLVFEHWLSLIKGIGFQDPTGKPPLIRGPNNQALYWLVLVAKHDLATRFWETISRDEMQDDIFASGNQGD
jgi:three-Cys-motif partner protein